MSSETPAHPTEETEPQPAAAAKLSERRQAIIQFVAEYSRDRGYPPSVREICKAVGLISPASVQRHLVILEQQGFLRRDPSKPRALEVHYDLVSGHAVDRHPVSYVPLVGDVAAGSGVLAHENIEETLPLPTEFVGHQDAFVLRVRGDSMTGDGIFDGDLLVVRMQHLAGEGDIVVAGLPGDEAAVKRFQRDGDEVVLVSSNPDYPPRRYPAKDLRIYGRAVSVLRTL
jgi:repressor LexA